MVEANWIVDPASLAGFITLRNSQIDAVVAELTMLPRNVQPGETAVTGICVLLNTQT